MRIMPRARHWKNSMNNHVILKGVDVEVIKVIQLASDMAEGPTTSFSTTMAEGPAPSTSGALLPRNNKL